MAGTATIPLSRYVGEGSRPLLCARDCVRATTGSINRWRCLSMQSLEREGKSKIKIRCSAGEPRANVLGVSVSAISMSDAVRYSDLLIQDGLSGYVCVTGVHGVMEAQSDEDFRSILNSSFLTTPDGMPTVWVGHWQGFSGMRRVSGPEYMVEMCKLSVERGYKHFLYGGKPGVADDL